MSAHLEAADEHRKATAHSSRSDCPVERYLSVFRDGWTLLIMRDLLEGPRRFNELRRSLTGITAKTLSERLAELRAAGVIDRTVFPEVPAKVVYSLTEKGRDFDRVLREARAWGERWLPLPDRS
ncbi:MAG: helix-turn-helix domain-containing protein [Nitrososphaerales archaeon]